MASKRKLLVLSLVILALGFWFYQPIPRKFSDPWKLGGKIIHRKLYVAFFRALHSVGLVPFTDGVNFWYRMQTSPPTQEALKHVKMVDARDFNGVRVRLYKPEGTPADISKNEKGSRHRGLVYFHGGGWVKGILEEMEDLWIKMADKDNILVASVDYRMAPKHPFPAAFDDCLAATKEFFKRADAMNVDPARIAVGGDSAGGNLAAAVLLKLRDENSLFKPKIQLLMYPVVQAMDFQLPSYMQNAHGPILTAELMAWYWSNYLVGDSRYVGAFLNNSHTTPVIKRSLYKTYLRHDRIPMDFRYAPYTPPGLDHGDMSVWTQIQDTMLNPYFAPLLAEDLSGLPKTFLFTCHYDVLRDEGTLFGQRLREAGVEVTHRNMAKGFHGVFGPNYGVFKETDDILAEYENFFRDNL